MSKPDDYYDCHPQCRTLEDLKKWYKKEVKKNFCCVHPPLLDIPLNHVVLDGLHLLLRVTDVLTWNIMDEMIEWENEDSHKNKVANPPPIGQHLQKAVQEINVCGISFQVWEKKKCRWRRLGNHMYDWTSLMGNEKKILPKLLPDRFPSFLRNETGNCQNCEKIWKVSKC